jgi:uncharacterized protein YsxB (DUF464 family)
MGGRREERGTYLHLEGILRHADGFEARAEDVVCASVSERVSGHVGQSANVDVVIQKQSGMEREGGVGRGGR